MSGNLRFVVIPKVAHPWFDEVQRGALSQARLLGDQLGVEIAVDYRPPRAASTSEQNAILAAALAARPDGIALDPVEEVGRMPLVTEISGHGIPLVLFDSPPPAPGITSVGNDFVRQGGVAAERLVELLGGRGKVAVMRGFPSAPNHRDRFEAQVAVLKKHSGIRIVDGGTDNDDIEVAGQQAAAVLASNPDLDGYLCCDAAGPIGIANAIRQAGRVGKVKVVGMDGIKPILEAIRDGVIEASSSTKPRMQGSMSILMLWQAVLGVRLPRAIDTGIDLITRDNVDDFLAECA
ncbi:MAG TPA: substrate-binding domain-containing protein [Vicinamibacterales bacterium]|nr:substrate-binding domain-containing protein [Vicinamibacterales bacterium]